MKCVHGIRLDKECAYCANGTEPQRSSASDSNALLSDLRAAVSLAAGMLERDGRPVRTDAAKELREKFGNLSESLT